MMFKKIFLITACVTLCSPLQALDYVYVAAASAGAQIAQDRNWWSVAATILYTTAGYALLKFCYGERKQTPQQPLQMDQTTNQTDPSEVQQLLNDAYLENDRLQQENIRLEKQRNTQNSQQADRKIIQEQNAAFQQARCQAALQEKDQQINVLTIEINNLTSENADLRTRIAELEAKEPKKEQNFENNGKLTEIMACLQRLQKSSIQEIQEFKKAVGCILEILAKNKPLETLIFEQTPQ